MKFQKKEKKSNQLCETVIQKCVRER